MSNFQMLQAASGIEIAIEIEIERLDITADGNFFCIVDTDTDFDTDFDLDDTHGQRTM